MGSAAMNKFPMTYSLAGVQPRISAGLFLYKLWV